MLLELIVSLVLWTGVDQEAKLQVSCAAVTLEYGGAATSNPQPVSFWIIDKEYDITWLYVVPMKVLPNGKIKLEPTMFWIEQLKIQDSIKLRVDNRDYNFDLTGTKDLINCDNVKIN